MRHLAAVVSLALALQFTPGASRPQAQTDDVPVHRATVDAKVANASAVATVSGLGTGAPAPSPAASAVPGPRPGGSPAAVSPVALPPSAPAHLSGTASWYCGHGSPCTTGHRPSQMAAAASKALQRLIGPHWRGSRVLVASRGQGGVAAIVVTLWDVCGCPDGRLVDLYASAFQNLAPLSRGIVAVTVEPLP